MPDDESGLFRIPTGLPSRRTVTALLACVLLALPTSATACTGAVSVCGSAQPGAVALIRGGAPATVMFDQADAGVARAARDLAQDLGRVAGAGARLVRAVPQGEQAVVIVGVLGQGGLVDRLAREGKLDGRGIAGRWEAYATQLVDAPLPGVARALVIAGADKRGAIFGAYDLSRRAGVSPWSWWADVPAPRRTELWVTPGRRVEAPEVRYRGIFLNDEAPALDGWVAKTFGGYNAAFYERVFELTLRLRGNFLWPAMWGKSLWDDDPRSAALANSMGVVLGTSHHEPMVRAHVEWERHGKGPWDYPKNAEALRGFWRRGIERMGSNETLVTIGMRGDGDEPMTEGTATELLERIVADQRAIIAGVTGKAPERTPQVWALYKEVQDYYDAGMNAPDDATLLFTDDNWGNIRRLPEPGAKRAGGYGVYYHFDYVGGPRNYKWINTNQIERVWEQMRRAYDHGADRLWVVNVGDLKPMEFPTSFFLDLAWNPSRWPVERMTGYPAEWAAEQFGPAESRVIGELLSGYTRLLSRRKPELLDPDTFDLGSGEADRVLTDWKRLEACARSVGARLGPAYADAFFQLVEHPILAGANLTRLYVTVARNRLHAAQGRADTNKLAEEARRLFARDAEIRRRYEVDTTSGKWTSMMAQTHIGYTGWQQPERDRMPDVVEIAVPEKGALGLAVPGSARGWRAGEVGATLPTFTPLSGLPTRFELFNRGREPVAFRVESAAPWVRLSRTPGELRDTAEIAAFVDWRVAPAGLSRVPITVSSGRERIELTLPVDSFAPPAPGSGFVEDGGVVAIEAHHFDKSRAGNDVRWAAIPGMGRTGSAVTSLPGTAEPSRADATGIWIEYPIWLRSGGELHLHILTSPSLDVTGRGRLRLAVSIDDGPPRELNLLEGEDEKIWARAVADNVRVARTRLAVDGAGRHRLRIWRIDPGVALQRIVLSREPSYPEYLGPRTSRRM